MMHYCWAAIVIRATWASVKDGLNWIVLELVDAELAPNALPIFDDILPNGLKLEPILALPVIDDGLNVGGALNGLCDWVTGSGLKSIREESGEKNIIFILVNGCDQNMKLETNTNLYLIMVFGRQRDY